MFQQKFLSIIVLLGAFFLGSPAFAQGTVSEMQRQSKIEDADTSIYVAVSVPPEFPGGLKALYDFFKKNVQYPEEAKNAKIDEILFLMFVVEKDGSISNPTIRKRLGYGCDEEALRVLKLVPKFKPAMMNDQLVRFSYAVPVRFSPTSKRR
ncbi:energy transducer TonB [Cytophagaceae bacterium DM2B3-1]|uniref:Energy transducer TonB n=1 Tax=Xanthocytophaga flava TaxID=3048013 RepID=A0ABT7CLZ6_9BACT|nr:energy transducer TonB [Xanthocytophaga flavus]MDJ1494571.1 energy transducer TonB [Xanthocytophaga flavus]